MVPAIPPTGERKLTGHLANNKDEFRSEFKDYMLGMGLKEKEVQAATLRRVMGSECRPIYKHNLGLSAELVKNPTGILDALANFKPTSSGGMIAPNINSIDTKSVSVLDRYEPGEIDSLL